MRKKLTKQTLQQLIDVGELIDDKNTFAQTSWVIYEES